MIRSMLVSPIRRYFVTKKMFRTAEEIAAKKQKKLMMIGDPCSGNYFQFMSKMFPNSGHGDVTLDLFGCDCCHRMDINDIDAWRDYEDGSFVVIELSLIHI